MKNMRETSGRKDIIVSNMNPEFLIFGQLTREYLLPPTGQARLDVAGDYPREWLNQCMARGFDTSGIKVLPVNLDVREFISYNESLEVTRINPVTHFARREMTFPKSLLGYQPPDEKKVVEAGTLIVTDIPDAYLTARGALICPMSLVAQTQLIASMKRGEVHTFVLEPAPGSMMPTARRELPALLNGVTAFLTSQEELKNLFWGETHDLWRMAEWVSMYGCEYVVIKCGVQGQLLYEVTRRASRTQSVWVMPSMEVFLRATAKATIQLKACYMEISRRR